MADKKLIKDALGLGEEYSLSNGATITVVPCGLIDIEDAMQMFNDTIFSTSLQFLYIPENKDKKDAFETLLLMANGQRFTEEQAEDRQVALRALKEKFTDVGDFGSEVVKYIQRFLRLVPRNTGTEVTE